MIEQKLEQRDDGFWTRLLEIIPGLMIWIIITSPLWAGMTFPNLMGAILIILSVYWLFRAFMTTLGASIGIYKVHQAKKQNWLEECLNLKTYDLPDPDTLPVGQFLPKHLLIYPQRVPQYEVLKTTLEGLRNQNYPLELITVVISFEERAAKKLDPGEVEAVKSKIQAEFPEFGGGINFFMHPEKLPGEVIGAAANRAWGGKNGVKLLEQRGEAISDYLITSPDEDIVFHPDFLAACTYKYLTSEKRIQKFYQTALYTFNNNYWNVPILIRVLVSGLTIPVLSSSVIEKHKRETFSCYTLNLGVLHSVGYWDARYGIDDTPFFWRPFFYFKGDWECEVFYVPLSADAIYNPSYVKNHKEQYRQYVRWGWGIIAFPIAVKGLLTVPGIALWRRVEKLFLLFEMFIFWKVLAILLTFALPIILIMNPELGEASFWYRAPQVLSNVMGLAVIFLIPNTIYKIIIAPPKPENWSWLRFWFIAIIEAPLNIVVLFVYSTLPFIEASTRLMIGESEAKTDNWSDKVREPEQN